jgi:hypothetical protein
MNSNQLTPSSSAMLPIAASEATLSRNGVITCGGKFDDASGFEPDSTNDQHSQHRGLRREYILFGKVVISHRSRSLTNCRSIHTKETSHCDAMELQIKSGVVRQQGW